MKFPAKIKQAIIKRKAGISAITFVLVAFLLWKHIFNAPIEFNAQVWREGDGLNFASKEFPRLRMADGLIKSGILLGKTMPELEALLGVQSKSTYFRPEYNLVYWLGPERGLIRIDGEWLVIKLNEEGISTVARIVRD